MVKTPDFIKLVLWSPYRSYVYHLAQLGDVTPALYQYNIDQGSNVARLWLGEALLLARAQGMGHHIWFPDKSNIRALVGTKTVYVDVTASVHDGSGLRRTQDTLAHQEVANVLALQQAHAETKE